MLMRVINEPMIRINTMEAKQACVAIAGDTEEELYGTINWADEVEKYVEEEKKNSHKLDVTLCGITINQDFVNDASGEKVYGYLNATRAIQANAVDCRCLQ